MARLVFLSLAFLAITCFASRCLATTYTVGDSSGWDISTDVESWARDKLFVVGDVLCCHSVAEVNRDSYPGCITSNVLRPSSNGSTTFALTKPGNRYFVCGNRLHGYAGMRLHVVVDGKAADGPAGAPEPEAGGDSTTTTTTNTPSSKNNNPSSLVPNSVMSVPIGFKPFVFVGFTCLLSWII
ncbi:hypothetical protein L1987_75185 [Smallanthus sonchifolius]|uniref:Uncharacterized protein n=1 Tax=Smallanthus sonchifolius TaxID=185202 RepID=A0ACB9A5R9_9ASTR|nr:hypothetical protein L1987_75185 [Smallanthus sonchifolius]